MKLILEHNDIAEGTFSYVEAEHSFNYIPANKGATAALVIGKTLQVEFLIDSGSLLYVWGYSPQESWEESAESIDPPNALSGSLRIDDLDGIDIGSGYATSLTNEPVHHYKGSGHFLIGDLSAAAQLVTIADNTTIGLDANQNMVCVVLRPRLEI